MPPKKISPKAFFMRKADHTQEAMNIFAYIFLYSLLCYCTSVPTVYYNVLLNDLCKPRILFKCLGSKCTVGLCKIFSVAIGIEWDVNVGAWVSLDYCMILYDVLICQYPPYHAWVIHENLFQVWSLLCCLHECLTANPNWDPSTYDSRDVFSW